MPPCDKFKSLSYWSPVKITAEHLLKGLRETASRYAKGKLLDIGCGTKPYEKIFKPFTESYFGIDYPITADKNYGKDTKADLYVDFTESGLDNDSFDTILSTQVMEHIYDTKKYIKECHRVLKQNGIGIFTIPFAWQCHAEPYDYYRFSKYSIDKLFSENGFEIVELRELEGAYETLIQLKIDSLYMTDSKKIFSRIIRKLRFWFFIPLLNFKALHFARLFWYNRKLCLNYLLVVKKPPQLDTL